jgi:hypothetical protein
MEDPFNVKVKLALSWLTHVRELWNRWCLCQFRPHMQPERHNKEVLDFNRSPSLQSLDSQCRSIQLARRELMIDVSRKVSFIPKVHIYSQWGSQCSKDLANYNSLCPCVCIGVFFPLPPTVARIERRRQRNNFFKYLVDPHLFPVWITTAMIFVQIMYAHAGALSLPGDLWRVITEFNYLEIYSLAPPVLPPPV